MPLTITYPGSSPFGQGLSRGVGGGSSFFSAAGQQLGLGDLLSGQVQDESEEMRRRRMLELQQHQQGLASGPMGPLGAAQQTLGLGGGGGGRRSPAYSSLFSGGF